MLNSLHNKSAGCQKNLFRENQSGLWGILAKMNLNRLSVDLDTDIRTGLSVRKYYNTQEYKEILRQLYASNK